MLASNTSSKYHERRSKYAVRGLDHKLWTIFQCPEDQRMELENGWFGRMILPYFQVNSFVKLQKGPKLWRIREAPNSQAAFICFFWGAGGKLAVFFQGVCFWSWQFPGVLNSWSFMKLQLVGMGKTWQNPTGWWQLIFFGNLTPIWGRFPIWRAYFFKWVGSTTN